jgi:hypothetical protein
LLPQIFKNDRIATTTTRIHPRPAAAASSSAATRPAQSIAQLNLSNNSIVTHGYFEGREFLFHFFGNN